MQKSLLLPILTVAFLIAYGATFFNIAEAQTTGSSGGICPGLITDKLAHPMTALTRPARLQAVTDPQFSTTIRRITDVKNDGRGANNVLKPVYSTVSAWNADESLLILYRTAGSGAGGHELFDGRTYEFIRKLDDIDPADLEQIYWDTTDPDILYYVNITTRQMIRYHISTRAKDVVHDFSNICPGDLTGGTDPMFTSWDSKVIGLVCGSKIFSYNISTDTVNTQITLATGNNAPQAAPSGTRFFLNENDTKGTVRDTNMSLLLTLNLGNSGEHASMTKLSNGQDTLNLVDFDSILNGTLVQHNMVTGAARVIVGPSTGYPYPPSGTHVTGMSFKRTGLAAVSVKGNLNGSGLLDSELLLVDTDLATNPSGEVCRIGHHRTASDDYWAEPHPVLSPSGTRLLFGSSWGNTGVIVDSYVVELPSYMGGSVTPPTPDTTAPSVPTGLTATAVSSSQINLAWNASTDNVGVTGYNIYRNGVQIASVAATSYNDTGLTTATSYFYTAQAYDVAGNSSAQSASVNATTQASASTGVTTYYISPSGNDANSGLSQGSPFKTFSKAFSMMKGGDELILLNGVYGTAQGTGYISYLGTGSAQPPSGTSLSNQTVVRAQNAGNVVVNGQLFIGRSTRKDSYIKIQGITFEGGGQLYNTSFVTVKDSGFHGSFDIGTNDHDFGNDYDLVEDVWIWASGQRIIAINYRSHHNIWRRVVVRGDGCGTSACAGSGNPNVGITVYNSMDVSVENVIVVDRILAAGDEPYGDFAVAQHDPGPNFGRAEWLGTISLNAPDNGYYMEPDVGGTVNPTINISNGVAWNSGGDGFNIARSGIDTVENVTAYGRGGDGVRIAPELTTGILRNVISTNAQRYGVNSKYPPNYVDVYNAAGGAYNQTTCGTGCYASNPIADGTTPSLKYITRIESGSFLKGKGSAGADIGANVVYRYGTDGTRWGDSGYNTLTATPLWPWPNEARIKTEMCANTTRGFCSTGKRLDGVNLVTFTSHIWEALGNPIPTEVYGGTTPPPPTPTPDTTLPSTPTNLFATAISSSQISLSWTVSTDNTGVTGYRVYRGGTLLTTVTTTSYSNTALSPSTTYSYTIEAIDAANNASAQSASASATTQAALPSTSTTYDLEGGTIPSVFDVTPGAPWVIATDQKHAGSYSIKSDNAAAGNSFSQLTLLANFEAGDISFWRRYESELNYDKFIFFIDGVAQTGYPKSGSGATWTQDAFVSSLTAGVHSLDWVYVKDSGSNFQGDGVWLDDIMVPNFTTISDKGESFESGIPSAWTNDATEIWSTTSATYRNKAGSNSARSYATIGNNSASTLQRTITTSAGDMWFYYYISSETGFDFLRFYIDGIEKTNVAASGDYDSTRTALNSGWIFRKYPVTAASHTFKWEYTTDSGTTLGGNAAFIDMVYIPTTSGTTTSPPTPAPTVTLTANPTSVTSSGSSTLTWFSTNSTSCTGSGSWSGTKAISGSQSITGITTTGTYTLSCTGTGGTANQSITVTVTSPPTCTTFTYSAWGSCQSNNTQSRTTTASSPQGCTGGTPVLTQSCVYTPPSPPTQTTCTIFTYSAWDVCQSDSTQSRTTTSTSPQGCTGGIPILSQSCTYTPPPTTTPPPSTGGGGTTSSGSGGGSSSSGGGTTTTSGGTTGTTGGTTTGGTTSSSDTTSSGGTSSGGTTTTGGTSSTGTPGTLPSLTGPFGIGMRSDQVKLLQQMLIKDGSLTGEATGYYGPLTQRAVETFQTKYNLVTSGSPGTTGFGLAGPGTRAKLNSLYAGSARGMSTDREALLASLRKQVAELIVILQGLIAKLAALKAGQGR